MNKQMMKLILKGFLNEYTEEQKDFLAELLADEKQLGNLFNTGMFNAYVKGACVLAMKSKGYSYKEANEVILELSTVFDLYTAGDMKRILNQLCDPL